MKQLKSLIHIFVLWTLVGVLSKVLFLLVYRSLFPQLAWSDAMAVVGHGLKLDVAVAGYLTLIPGLLLATSVWAAGRALGWLWRGYFALTALVATLAYVSNLGLYAYWGFPLDSTPLLYITTSPADALASVPTWQLIALPLLIVGVAAVIYRLMPRLPEPLARRRAPWSTVLVVLSALLFIPIRGGFGTGTNHTGGVYFSTDIRLNHAAVNPLFSFVESATHREEIATRYRFMDDREATRLFTPMTKTQLRANAEKHDYNVVLICMESFSRYVMTEAGHVSGVTPWLDRYAREGLYFSNILASSFRTDRGLVAVLSALPAQPTMSVMDQPRISTTLPSLARRLGRDGYATQFYYGGDTNFSNMNSYLVGTGYQHVTSQPDFPAALSTGKWGVADGPVYDRVLADIKQQRAPFFKTIMTSSSHEPFDVPHYQKLADPALNAFSYADHCLGSFIERLKTLPCWKNTLVVIVPDHLGAYPQQVDNYQRWRYEIPLIFLGGMMEEPRRIDTIGSQTDVAATLLALLGKSHEEFRYSKDLLDPTAPHYAFFSFPDAMGLATATQFLYYDNTSRRAITKEGPRAEALLPQAKAFLQKLYDDLGDK